MSSTMMTSYSRDQQLRGHTFHEYLRKNEKVLHNHFSLLIWGLGRVFDMKKQVENLVTLSLLACIPG